jgi:HPt (histidine-containing phosphotransfer) domain-containing protein
LPEDFPDLLADWLTGTETALEQARKLLAAQDWAGLARLAHGLVGSAGVFGALRLEQAARRAEDACGEAAEAGPGTQRGTERAVAAMLAVGQETNRVMQSRGDRRPRQPA